MSVHFGGVLSAYSQLNQKEQERGKTYFPKTTSMIYHEIIMTDSLFTVRLLFLLTRLLKGTGSSC